MHDLIQKLNNVPTFKDLPENQIKWLAEKGEVMHLNPGDFVFRKGDEVAHLLVVFSGKYEIRIEQNGQFRLFSEMVPGSVTGALPYSRAKIGIAQGLVLEATEIYMLNKSYFEDMIHTHYELTERLVHTLTNRVRDFTKQQQMNEKMVALGKIAAGLAHELNNPSSAVVRSASELKQHLGLLPDKFKSVVRIRMNEEQIDAVNDVLFSKLNEGIKNKLSLMERTEKEDEIADWLEEKSVEDAYELAADFVEFGIDIQDLEKVDAEIDQEEDLFPVINWMNNMLVTEKLVQEIEEASKRISDLVSSVKIYTHMDKSPEKQLVDIHEGILNTLVILKHKFRKNNVDFVKIFQDELPQVNIFVSEMNQVWTNLIDNALDAMEDNGGQA